jgi:sec-independent protein translocase protein TatC
MSKENKLTNWFQALKNRAGEAGTGTDMSFFDHLEALRWHLIRSAIAILILTILSFNYFDFVFDRIIMGPKRPDFWTYRMMCLAGKYFHLGPGYCMQEIKFNIINTELSGQFTLQINSSLILGIVLGFPYLLFELWQFIKPALSTIEKKAANGIVFYASLLFGLGVLFGYYIIAPYSIRFLAGFQVSEMISNQITIDSYLSSVVTLTLCTGIVFELPMLALILSKLGLLTPQLMRSSRRYAIIIMLVIAAIVTPTPDVQTMLIVTFPLLLLYEISIVVSSRVEKRRRFSV